jgi:hypothetical protein
MQGHRLLLHIGYPKAGTHFVQRWFGQHPDIELISGRFVTADALEKLRAQIAGAEASAPDSADRRLTVVSDESLVLGIGHQEARIAKEEVAPLTLEDVEATCRRLAAAFPQAHVLILTRGFRSMLVSGFSQRVRAGGSLAFFTRRDADFNARGVSEAFLNYDFAVQAYQRHFAGRVVVLPYELLAEDPDLFVRALSAQIGVEFRPSSTERFNPSLSGLELAWYPRLSGWLKALPLPSGLRDRLFQAYKKRIGSPKLGRAIGILNALSPMPPVSIEEIPDDAVAYFRGRAASLAALETYANYRRHYLLPPPA